MSKNTIGLLEAQAYSTGTLVIATHYVVGRNDGSIYIRLFNKWLKRSSMSVYENEFFRFPKEWASVISDAKATGAKLKPKKAVISDTEDAIDRNLLKALPVPAEVIRFKYPGEDEKMQRWRFHGIYQLLPHLIAKEPTESEVDETQTISTESPTFDITQPPTFTAMADCIDWAMQSGIFAEREDAKTAYAVVRKERNPQKPAEMYVAWIEHVQSVYRLYQEKKQGF